MDTLENTSHIEVVSRIQNQGENGQHEECSLKKLTETLEHGKMEKYCLINHLFVHLYLENNDWKVGAIKHLFDIPFIGLSINLSVICVLGKDLVIKAEFFYLLQ